MHTTKAALAKATAPTRRVLRIGDVEQITSLKRARIRELVAEGLFPKPFKLVAGGRASGWFSTTIDSYLEERAAASGAAQ